MRYVFIQPRSLKPREPRLAIGREKAKLAVAWLADQPIPPEIVHYDLETVGLVAVDKQRVITNVGIATNAWCIGIDLTQLTPEEARPVWDWLKQCRLGGFNLHFDIKWPWGTDITLDMIGCDTAVWYRWLATEQLKSQPHSLENAISSVLGWPEESFQKTWLKDQLKKHNLKKDTMYKLALKEPEGYTRYCALDAEASFQLERVLAEDTERHGFTKKWEQFAHNILPHKMYRNIQAEYFGIEIDRKQCFRWIIELQREALLQEAKILAHSEVSPFIQDWYERKKAELYRLKVQEKRIYAKKSDEPWLDIENWRFEVAEDVLKLPAWTQEFGGRFYKVEPKIDVVGKTKPLPRFNFHSTDDMKWLIYDCWLKGTDYQIVYYQDGRAGHVDVHKDGVTYELEVTQSGGLPTGGDILKLFGEVGTMINNVKKIHKILGDFLWKYYNASKADGKIHVGLKINGAGTGRASGT